MPRTAKPTPSSTFWVYVLLCENQTYYTGYTTDLTARYESHLKGTGRCKYTRSFKPLCIAQSWLVAGTKAEAMTVERYIKKLTRHEKDKLVNNPVDLVQHFSTLGLTISIGRWQLG